MQKYKLFGPNHQKFDDLAEAAIGLYISNVMLRNLSKLTFPLEVDAEDEPDDADIITVAVPLEFPHNIWALSWFIHEKIDQ